MIVEEEEKNKSEREQRYLNKTAKWKNTPTDLTQPSYSQNQNSGDIDWTAEGSHEQFDCKVSLWMKEEEETGDW